MWQKLKIGLRLNFNQRFKVLNSKLSHLTIVKENGYLPVFRVRFKYVPRLFLKYSVPFLVFWLCAVP